MSWIQLANKCSKLSTKIIVVVQNRHHLEAYLTGTVRSVSQTPSLGWVSCPAVLVILLVSRVRDLGDELSSSDG